MIKEIDLFGVYLSPMVGYAIAAALIWQALRYLLGRQGAYRWVWHRPLFDLALFVIVLAGLVAGTWHLRP
jgi:protein AaeX